jgi:Arc/MetJ family transcription regulator
MPNAEIADLRLRAARLLPAAVEAAFRAAVRESVFIRNECVPFETTLRHRALFHLDRLLRGWTLSATNRDRARAAVSASVTRFVQSPLCRRLISVPLERLHTSPHREFDLLASGAGGRRFAIRFATRVNCLELTRSPRRLVNDGPDLAAILIYDIEDGRLHRHKLSTTPALLTA